ncbi:MvdC/MvdD family ATP grasp protein [Streptomyces sp. NPDC058773]|uniref:MvdC/MvdD family ATP grasp protein n=1 Tax=Streptomyces sp. NPDC058773 TaxID=3346632 RepID=UPI0036B525E7
MDGPFEAGTDLVVEGLSAAGIPVFRMDTRDFPHELELRASNVDGQWVGSLANKYRSVELTDVGAVYWNRPRLFEFPELSESDAHWARGAARIGFGGVLTSLRAHWMNHPTRASAAEFKPQQLRVARLAGLPTPRTLITNSADEVRSFADGIGGPVITKPLGTPYISHTNGSETMYTREVDLSSLDGVDQTAHLFQERVIKDYEVRLICVGGACHSVKIKTHSEAAAIDWRADYDSLEYEPIDPPDAVTVGVRSYMARMSLTYAAFDFIVQPNGEWTFLEANPSGQWAWLDCPEIPLASAISHTLEAWCRP